MKTSGKLKLLGLSVLIMAGMSSCLKSKDPGFGFVGITAYIQQTGAGDNASFRPAIQIQANEPIKQAVAKYDGTSYYFRSIDGTGYVMEIDPTFNFASDTILNGYFAITATNAENEVASTQVGFSADSVLGALDVTEFAYKSTGRVTAKWNKVDRAERYYLVYKTVNYMWIPYISLTPNENGDELSASFDLSLLKDQEYRLAIAASRKSLLTVGIPLSVTGGKDASINE